MEVDTLLNFEDVLNTYKSKEHGIKTLSKYVHWFPLRPSSLLAGIISDLIGDGHVQSGNKLRLDYTSKSIEELQRFGKEVYAVFGVKGKIRKNTTNSYGTMNYGINCKPLIRVLKLIGVPTGQKVLTKFSTPKWILEDKILFARFINRLFSCEASVDSNYKFIEIQMYKSTILIEDGINFFKEIKKYLDDYFNITTTNPFIEKRLNVRKDGIKTQAIRLNIKQKDSVLRFKNLIGIEDPIKKIKLEKITS